MENWDKAKKGKRAGKSCENHYKNLVCTFPDLQKYF